MNRQAIRNRGVRGESINVREMLPASPSGGSTVCGKAE